MKALKKVMSVLISALMIFTFALPAFADNVTETGSITIDNAVVGETYKAYKLLDLESYDEANGYAVYKVNDTWAKFFKTGDGKDYIKVDDKTGYATWNEATTSDAANWKALSDKAIAYAADESNNITAEAEKTAATAEVKFEDLGLGYYLVTSSVGTLCVLDTTNPDGHSSGQERSPRCRQENRGRQI